MSWPSQRVLPALRGRGAYGDDSVTHNSRQDDGGYSASRCHPGLQAEAPPSDPINAFTPDGANPMVLGRTHIATTAARVAHSVLRPVDDRQVAWAHEQRLPHPGAKIDLATLVGVAR